MYLVHETRWHALRLTAAASLCHRARLLPLDQSD